MPFSDPLKTTVKRKANFTCCWCLDRTNKVHVHHIVPESQSGPDTEENAAPLCGSCHDLYGNNPDHRKEVRLRRDHWYQICEAVASTANAADAPTVSSVPQRTIVPLPKPDQRSCWWHMGESGDNPIMQVVGRYTVTNISGLPVLLTLAKMKSPELLGHVSTRQVDGPYHGSYFIPPTATTSASFNFWIDPPIKNEGEVFSSTVALVDQFGNGHTLGTVRFLYR